MDAMLTFGMVVTMLGVLAWILTHTVHDGYSEINCQEIVPLMECARVEQRHGKRERHQVAWYYTSQYTRSLRKRFYYKHLIGNLGIFVRALRKEITSPGYVARSDTSADTVATLTMWPTVFHMLLEWVTGWDYSIVAVEAGHIEEGRLRFRVIKDHSDNFVRPLVVSVNEGM